MSVKMKAPSAMKDSGIEWIGEIPEHWEVRKLSHICETITDFTASGSFADLAANVKYLDTEDYARLIRTADLSGKREVKPVYINEHAYNYLNNSNLFGGEVILPNIGASIGDVYRYIPIYERATLAPNSIMLRSHGSNEYLYYLFYTNQFRNFINIESSSTAQGKFNKTQLRSFKIPYPPIEEQRLIAVQLNQICGTLDNTKADIEKQIEILNEYKKSVITEAVTKGLDKNAKLKDSGIDWIGEIPEHWNVIPLKYALACPMKYGATESGVEYDENLPRYIRITDISLDGNLKDDGKLSLTERQANGYILDKKCILFARSGATVGKTFMYKPEYGKAAFAGYLISAVLDENKMKTEWLKYYSSSNNYWEWANMIFTQATVQNIGADKYVNLPITIPPIEEQEEIVAYLDSKCSEIDSIIETKKQQLELLEEYKKSIIYEYVTGKREVSAKPDAQAGDSHNE